MKHPPNINSDQVKNTLMTALVGKLYIAWSGYQKAHLYIPK